MKICVAQTRPVKGNIPTNIINHKRLIELANNNGADTIIFPELSLSGYEPQLAKELATHPDDSIFDDFQKISNHKQITIGVGIPLKTTAGICISMLIFQPHSIRQIYSKKYLHPDEEAFFVSGQNSTGLINNNNIALAICYELSVPEHFENASKSGAEIYIASVAKTAIGVEQASKRLSDIAGNFSIPVLMSNSVGPSDNFISAGKTSIWNNEGTLLGQLNDISEGLLIFDTDTQQIIADTI